MNLATRTLAIRARRYQGYSLIELIITIVLTSIAMTMLFTVFGSMQINSVSPVFQIKAAALSQAYMEEILLKKFDEVSPAGNSARCNSPGNPVCSGVLGSDGETRSQYDDVDDYDGVSDTPPQDALGNNRTGFANFTANITVSYAGSDFGLTNTDLKKIEITIIAPRDQFVFAAYKGNF